MCVGVSTVTQCLRCKLHLVHSLKCQFLTVYVSDKIYHLQTFIDRQGGEDDKDDDCEVCSDSENGVTFPNCEHIN